MFTRINSDACTISQEDLINSALYDFRFAQTGNFRREQTLNDQIYANQGPGLEMNYNLEAHLRGLGGVANSCNSYAASVQANLQASAGPQHDICMSKALAPEYTLGLKSGRHYDTYESGRARIGDWHFYSPPMPLAPVGEHQINRYSATRQNTKDALAAENKQLRKCYWGQTNGY